ncbi:unnamed protein product [Staurois parvus]|uniref:Secreted protein n=1 Tax=Staurois parvus TaxID=386267 RepID=A0ABN9GHU8_9NEOB|nr:unnamed protein product [Staurois parvus]
MLVILTVEPKGLIRCIVYKGCLILSSLPLLLLNDHLIQTEPVVKCTCSVCYVLLERFFFFGRVHVISTGPISTVQTEVRVFTSS